MIRHRRALLGVALAGLWALTAVPVALAARKWTLDASPTSIAVDDPVVVTLTVQNVGGDGGGDEITCVTIDVPADVHDRRRERRLGEGRHVPASHGWIADVNGARAMFRNPKDHNPLVGLPEAGDQAVFRVSGTATSGGTQSWSGGAADKPGASGSANCGSGDVPQALGLDQRLVADPGPDADADARADADPATDAVADAATHAHRDAVADPRTHAHADAAGRHADAEPHGGADTVADAAPHADAHPDPGAHGDGPPRLHAVIAAHGDARRDRVGDARRVPVSGRIRLCVPVRVERALTVGECRSAAHRGDAVAIRTRRGGPGWGAGWQSGRRR